MKFLHKNKTAQPTVATTAPLATAPAYYSYPPLANAPAPVLNQPNLVYANAPPPVLNQPNLVYVGSTVQTTAPIATRGIATTYTQNPVNYSKVLRRVHVLNESMVRLQGQRIAHENLDAKGMRVYQELQVVLTDIESFLVTKNGDMKFQQLADHFFALAGELRNDRELATFVSSWKSSRQGDLNVDGTINNASVLFHDIKSSRNVYQCFTEALKLAEYILSSDEEHDLESQKKKVYEELITLLKGIGENPRWKVIAGEGKATAAGLNARTRTVISNRPHLHLKQRPGFEILMYDIKKALEVLMVDHDGVAVDLFFKSVEEFMGELFKSPAFHELLKNAKEAATEIMEDPEILSDPETRELLWNLWNTLVEIISTTKKHPSFLTAFTEAKHISKSLLADPYAHNILTHTKLLLKDIYKNEEGRTIDFSLIPQFKHILVPLMLESFREVRIPPIQGVTSDKKIKYYVSGIALSSIEMLPENIKIEATYRMNTDPLRLDVHEKDIILWVEADKVRASVTGAAWNYERLTFPRLGDAGLASVVLGGQGAKVGAKIRIHKQGNEHVMQVIDSYCNISRLDLTMFECKYAVLYKVLHKQLVKQLKSVIELGIAEKLTQLVTGLDRTVLKTIMNIQTAKSAVVKTAHSSKRRIMKKKSARTKPSSSSEDGEKKSKKEKLLGIATSSSTKRRGLSLIKKARKTTETKADSRPSLNEINHAPPPTPAAAPTNLPPLVAPSTIPLPPLVAPPTMPLPPLVAPITTPITPLVAPVVTRTSTTILSPAPLAFDSETASLPSTPVNLAAPSLSKGTLTSSDAADMGIGGTHVITTTHSTPSHAIGVTSTNADSTAAGILANMDKSNGGPIVPSPNVSGIASI